MYYSYADLDFQNVYRVVSDDVAHTIAHPFSVDIFEDTMYWTDWNEFKVYKANKRDGSNIQEVLKELVHRPMDIHVLHEFKQDTSKQLLEVQSKTQYVQISKIITSIKHPVNLMALCSFF